jgi:polyferredoxin
VISGEVVLSSHFPSSTLPYRAERPTRSPDRALAPSKRKRGTLRVPKSIHEWKLLVCPEGSERTKSLECALISVCQLGRPASQLVECQR